MDKKYDIVILAPVGSYESLHAAINAGCNEIYFGITQLNMRARSANNFTFEDLKEIASICNKNGVKTNLTLNTVVYDHDIKLAHKIIDSAKENGINSIIASDMAVILYCKKIGQEVHISTQVSVTNYETVEFFSQYSDRIVLARELTLDMMKQICEEIKKNDLRGPKGNLIEIEVFAHGALCVAYSGQCGMSLLTDNASANRGACMQPCRREYRIIDLETNIALNIENNFVMSPSDLCTIGFLDKLLETGVKVLKFEGRGRSPEYVDRVIKTYREAVDSIEAGTYTKEKIVRWNKELGTVFNKGFESGYYLGKPFHEWSGVYGSKATREKIFIGTIKHFYPKVSIAEIQIESSEISENEEYLVTGPTTGVMRNKMPEIVLDEDGKPKKVKNAKKGDLITIKVTDRVRSGDKFYKIIERKS